MSADATPVPVAADATSITVDDRVTYVWGARRRPMVHPLATPAGVVLTRDAPADHPWHHGLWFTIKYVNGENFWEEYDAYGVLRHDGPPTVQASGRGVLVRGGLRWIRPDRETVVLREQRLLHYERLGVDAYRLGFSTRLRAEADVVLDRTPFTTWGGYGGLTLRGRSDWHDTRILLDDGVERSRAVGERSRWFALDGPVGTGDDPAGVLVIPAASNPRMPHPWYASTKADTYGDEGWSNFANAAFLWDGPLALERGCVVPLQYTVVVHDGLWDLDRIRAEVAAVEERHR